VCRLPAWRRAPQLSGAAVSDADQLTRQARENVRRVPWPTVLAGAGGVSMLTLLAVAGVGPLVTAAAAGTLSLAALQGWLGGLGANALAGWVAAWAGSAAARALRDEEQAAELERRAAADPGIADALARLLGAIDAVPQSLEALAEEVGAQSDLLLAQHALLQRIAADVERPGLAGEAERVISAVGGQVDAATAAILEDLRALRDATAASVEVRAEGERATAIHATNSSVSVDNRVGVQISGQTGDIYIGTVVLSDQAISEEASRRAQRLHSLLHDHSGFIASRLEAFVGREAELAEVRARIAEKLPTGGYVTVTGHAGQGKSSMLARLLQEYDPATTAHHFIPLKPGPDHQVGLLRNLLARLILKHNLSEIYVASDSRPALRDYFPQVLKEIAATGVQEVIFIDGLDQIEEDVSGERDLSFLPLEPPPGIVFVLGTRPNDALRPLELRKPHYPYHLPNLSRGDFARILAHRGVAGLDPALVERFYAAMQENALYLDLVARELAQEDAPAPKRVIARIADNPENLFSLSIERLKRDRQRWRTVLKPIFGLLLAARDPLSARALRALIGVEDDECREGLERLGGLLARDGEGRYYLYHLKLNDFLRQSPERPRTDHVFAEDEEESYHQRLADWCAGGRGGLAALWQDAPGDALERERRRYGRQHYIPHLAAARSYEQLWTVVEEGSYGRAKLRDDPSGRSYLLDLDVARDAVIASAENEAAGTTAILGQLWRYSLLRCMLASRAENLPDEFFSLMAQLGEEQYVINLAEMLTESLWKAERLALIAKELGRKPQRRADAQTVLARARQVARDSARCELRVDAFIKVAEAAIEIGELNLAAEVWDDACREISEIPSASVICNKLCHIAKQQQTHHKSEAEQTLYQAYAYAQSIAIAHLRAEALIDIAQTFAEIRAFDRACAAAAAIDNAPSRAAAFSNVAQAFAKNGIFDQARAAAEAINDAPYRAAALCDIAEALIKAGETAQALDLLQLARTAADVTTSTRAHARALGKVAQGLVQAGAFDQAHATVEVISDAYLHAQALINLVKTFAEVGAFDQAYAVTMALNNAPSRAKAFNSIAQALTKTGKTAQAIAFLQLARTAANTIANTHSRAEVLGDIAQALAHAGAFDQAYATIEVVNHSPSRAKALGHVARALAQAGAFDQARITADSINDGPSRAQALSDVAQILTHVGAFDKARAIAEAITDTHFQGQALSIVVQAFAQAGAFNQACSTAEAIRDVYSRARTLCKVAQALVQAGDFGQALTLLELVRATAGTMNDSRFRARALSSVALALAHVGVPKQALALLQLARTAAEAIGDADARARALSSVAIVLARAGEPAQALTLLELARAAAEAVDETVTRTRALSSVALALARAGALDQARVVAEAVDDAATRARALSSVAQALAQAGEPAQALALLQLARTATEAVEDAFSRANALSSVAQALAQAGAFDQARATAEAVEDAFTRARALSSVAQALAQAGAFDQARAAVEAIDNADIRALTLSSVAEALAHAGAFDQARAAAEAVDDAATRARALSSVAQALAQAGEPAQALAFVQLARTTAETVESAPIRAHALSSVAEALSRAGEPDQALALLQFARAAAEAVENASSRAHALSSVAQALAQAGAFDQARATAEAIDETVIRANALSSVAEALAQAGESDRLEKLVVRAWRDAATYNYFMQIVALPSGRLILAAELHNQIPSGMEWASRMLQQPAHSRTS
jgi:tetratricopeptide (TPR) repeat protein